MADFQLKLKLIYLRLLLIQTGFIAVYSYFNWYLFMQRNWLHLDEAVTNFAIPAILAFIPVIVFLLPRLRLLDYSGKKGKNPIAGGIVIAFFATIVTALTVQNYLFTATGKLTRLQTISQINHQPKTKYYILKQHYTDTKDVYMYYHRYTSGKGNSRLNFDAFVVSPIYSALPDTTPIRHHLPHAWVGTLYSEDHNNHTSQIKKDELFSAFADRVRVDYKAQNADDFIYLDRLGESKRREYYKKALDLANVHDDSPEIIFEAYNRPFANHNGNSLWWVLLAFAGGSGLFMVILAGTPLDKSKVADYQPINPGDYSNWKSKDHQ